MDNLRLTAVTSLDRNRVTTLIMDGISASGGWLEDLHMFSNIMTTLRFNMPKNRVTEFLEGLANMGLNVDGGPAAFEGSPGKSEWVASLQITFVHQEADLKREIPQVPG